MTILAIDPGPVESAYCLLGDDGTPFDFAKVPNDFICMAGADHYVIEMIACYGMAVGAEVFETCVWIGRYTERCPGPLHRLKRLDCKLHLCKSPKANDSNIRAALIDRFGGKDAAIGTSKSRGPLFGMSKDCWAALAVSVTYRDRLQNCITDNRTIA